MVFSRYSNFLIWSDWQLQIIEINLDMCHKTSISWFKYKYILNGLRTYTMPCIIAVFAWYIDMIKAETDFIPSITASLITDVIVFIGYVIMCLISDWAILYSIMIILLILEILLCEIKGKIHELPIKVYELFLILSLSYEAFISHWPHFSWCCR